MHFCFALWALVSCILFGCLWGIALLVINSKLSKKKIRNKSAANKLKNSNKSGTNKNKISSKIAANQHQICSKSAPK